MIGFTGNRFGLTENQKKEIRTILDTYQNITLYHGDCIGADTMFHELCVEYKKNNINKIINIIIFPPDDDKLRGFNKGDIIMPPKPYLKRNEDIVNKCDVLIACPLDKNKEILRSGTWATIRKARKLNKTIHLL